MRNTPIRAAIIDIFNATTCPLTVSEIKSLLAKRKLFPNKTTLYRQIDFLLRNELVQKFHFQEAVTHYEKTNNHHHHFVCNDCSAISCIEDEKLEQSVRDLENALQKSGLQITSHEFSMSGLCKTCI